MHIRLGKYLIEGHAGVADGFDFSISTPKHNAQFDYTVHQNAFAIWWARGCDCGVYLRGIGELRRSFVRLAP